MTGERNAAPAEVVASRADIAARIEVLASEIAPAYDGARGPVVLVSVLTGSTLFVADLMRALDIDLCVDFMSISSYASGGRSGVVQIVKDLEEDVTGKDVLIVEDIVDTGLTLNYLRRTLGERHPASLSTVTLLDKAVRRIVPVPVEHVGFEIDDAFVVGYGLDFQGRYRNVPDILAVRDVARLANQPLLLVDELFAPAR
ncbi:MAG: hypoxanthine phosphoribosyltransferase [Actinomycetota bacterium]|nr:hypoxanthine phosphoribosyltransferase [Actinomycetota bacterium]